LRAGVRSRLLFFLLFGFFFQAKPLVDWGPFRIIICLAAGKAAIDANIDSVDGVNLPYGDARGA